jgi:osmoprotectant transport system permease protein
MDQGAEVAVHIIGEAFSYIGSHWSGPNGAAHRLWEHLLFSLKAVLLATVVALPVGLVLGHLRKGSFVAVSFSGIARALPTLGLVVLVAVWKPLTEWPVIVVLALLAIPPILANTYVGIAGVDADTRDAARGMGLTGNQVLRRIELPLAAPLIVTGFRSAANQVIATATVAAYVGLGGLGRFLIDGLAGGDKVQFTAGAVLVVILALIVEGLFALLQRAVSPRGVGNDRRLRRASVAGPPVDDMTSVAGAPVGAG